MRKQRTSIECRGCSTRWKPRWIIDNLCPCCRSNQVAAGERAPNSARPNKKPKKLTLHLRAHWGERQTSQTFCGKTLPDEICVMFKDDMTCLDCWEEFRRLFPHRLQTNIETP